MPVERILRTSEEVLDINALIRRQDDLEREIKQLRDLYGSLSKSHVTDVEQIYKRIGSLERELVDLRTTINEMKDSVELVHRSVITVEKHVSEINVKQDVTIQSQDRFISQLWKAFFALLGVITAAGAAIFAMS